MHAAFDVLAPALAILFLALFLIERHFAKKEFEATKKARTDLLLQFNDQQRQFTLTTTLMTEHFQAETERIRQLYLEDLAKRQ